MRQVNASHEKVLKTYLERQKKRINQQLRKSLVTLQPRKITPRDFKESTLHSVLLGGKRLRPITVLAVYEACGGKENMLPAACTIELIHAGSLMLDDLPCMDNADYRRGEPTSHKLFGEATTILASAALWAAAFEILAAVDSDQSLELIQKMARTIGGKGLIQGQLLDLAAFNNAQTIAQLQECYRLKTGVLFSLATVMGAALAGADATTRDVFESFGEHLGIAFQIRDDIVDATESFEQTGKDTNLDSINHKPTYVSLLGLEGAKSELRNILDSCHELLTKTGFVAEGSMLHLIVEHLATS